MKKQTHSVPTKPSTDSIFEGIKRAEQDIKDGRVFTHAQTKEKLKNWLRY